MRNALRIAMILFSLFPSRLAPNDGVRTAIVHIVVVDGLGKNLGAPEIASFVADGSGQDYGVQFQDGKANVPFGDYTIKVRSLGFFSTEKHVEVFQSEVWVVAGLLPGSQSRDAEPLTTLTGKINNVPPREGPIYLRLCGVYLDLVLDTVLDDNAQQFSFTARIPTGKFVLTASGQSGVLKAMEVDLPTTKPVLLNLKR